MKGLERGGIVPSVILFLSHALEQFRHYLLYLLGRHYLCIEEYFAKQPMAVAIQFLSDLAR